MTSENFKRSAGYQWRRGTQGRTSPGGASPTKEDTHSRLSDMGGGGMNDESVGYEVCVLGFAATPEDDDMVSARMRAVIVRRRQVGFRGKDVVALTTPTACPQTALGP